jgi:hypothetical protein
MTRWAKWRSVYRRDNGDERRTKWHAAATGDETLCGRPIGGDGLRFVTELKANPWDVCKWCRRKAEEA